MRFDGWIPTVTGHLSFTAIGGSTYPQKCVSARDDKSVCIEQTRDLLDVVVPFAEHNLVGRFAREYFSNLVIGISGHFSFSVCLDRANNGQDVVGTCFLVPMKNNRKTVRAVRKSIASIPDHDPSYLDVKSEFVSTMSNVAVCTANISISRSGHAKIEIGNMPLLENTDEDERNHLARLAANQIFYFLKDVSHVHQHHDPKQDAITEVTPFDPSDAERWIEKTQNSLYREIIRYKRFRNERSLFRASGVLSYAKSFEKSIGAGSTITRPFNTDELEVSLAVSREELQHNDQKKIAELDSVRNWFFALFGFIISTSFIVRSSSEQIDIKADKSLVWITRFIAENPIPVVFLILFLSFVTSFLTHRRDPANFQLVRSVLRWSQGFRMRWYFVSNLAWTIVFMAIFYYLLLRPLF